MADDYPIMRDGYGREFVKVSVEDFVKMEVRLARCRDRLSDPPPLDVERLAIALRDSQYGLPLKRFSTDSHRERAGRIAAEYARLAASASEGDDE